MNKFHLKAYQKFALMLSASFTGITMDLYSTWFAITFFGAIEINPFGNQPLLFYPIVMGSALIMYYFIKKVPASPSYKKVWKATLILFISFPYISFIRNILVIVGWL